MKSVGIIAEYNPFHNGHLYHLNCAKADTGADVCVVAMSGNFVQRGELAIADKWERAKAAVCCGADLVVEIPVVFACNSAAYFAKGGVEILENLGMDYIAFGSESGNIEELQSIASEIKLKRNDMEDEIKKFVKLGYTYPKARSEVIGNIIGERALEVAKTPNNILALEYLQEIKSAKPVSIERLGPGYNDLKAEKNLASATAIRKMIVDKERILELIPPKSAEILMESAKPSDEILFKLICQKVFATDSKKLDELLAGGEGLGNKLKKSIRSCHSIDEVVEMLKSKRYTRTRIQRFLMHAILEIYEMDKYQNYVRVLAFNKKGSTYLKSIKKLDICKLPVITNINKDAVNYPNLKETLEKDILASDLYNVIAEKDLYKFSDYVKMPFVAETCTETN